VRGFPGGAARWVVVVVGLSELGRAARGEDGPARRSKRAGSLPGGSVPSWVSSLSNLNWSG
jgi:hypothetical protein